MIHAKAPLRISLCGGGTDHPSWYRKHGGAVLTVAIDRYAHCTVEMLDRLRPYKASEQHLSATYPVTNMNYWCDTPVGSGLGGSSAVAVAVVAAQDRLHGIERGRQELLTGAYLMERAHLRYEGGLQDYYPATYGGCMHLKFQPGYEPDIRTPLPIAIASQFAKWLLLCWTGQRSNKALAKDKDAAIRESKAAQDALHRTTEITQAMHHALLSGNYSLVGYLMQEAWRRKKESSPGCATERGDALIQKALGAGALGGKLCGSGGGGYLVLCAPPEKHQRVKEALEPLDCVCEPVGFDHDGVQVEGEA